MPSVGGVQGLTVAARDLAPGMVLTTAGGHEVTVDTVIVDGERVHLRALRSNGWVHEEVLPVGREVEIRG